MLMLVIVDALAGPGPDKALDARSGNFRTLRLAKIYRIVT